MQNKIQKTMEKNMIERTRQQKPLVHAITNFVTMNDVANILLACGGSPIMAMAPEEVEEITSICDGLVLNMGTLRKETIEAMILAGKRANDLGHIVVLDPVGVGASQMRKTAAKRILEEVNISIIRGNVSEMKTLWSGTNATNGVDVNATELVSVDNVEEKVAFAKKLAKKYNTIIAMTGTVDVVADENTAFVIKNGVEIMSHITGTGCMLTGVVAAFASANKEHLLEATATAVGAMGICGEYALRRMAIKLESGTGSFRMYLMDNMSNMTDEMIAGGMQYEMR